MSVCVCAHVCVRVCRWVRDLHDYGVCMCESCPPSSAAPAGLLQTVLKCYQLEDRKEEKKTVRTVIALLM